MWRWRGCLLEGGERVWEVVVESGASKLQAAAHTLRHELTIWFWVSLYLFVLFTAVLLYGWAKSGTQGRAITEVGLAAMQAVVLGKFVLFGKIFGVGVLPKREPLVRRVLRRTFSILLVVAAFVALEEMAVSVFHGGTAMDGLREYADRGAPDLLASMLLMYLVLMPLSMLLEFARHFPPGEIKAIFFGHGS
jgi:hypothetical protein